MTSKSKFSVRNTNGNSPLCEFLVKRNEVEARRRFETQDGATVQPISGPQTRPSEGCETGFQLVVECLHVIEDIFGVEGAE